MNGDNEVEGKNQASEPPWLLITAIIGAGAGILGGFVRGSELEFGELSIGFTVHLYFCGFYLVFAGIIAAVIGHVLLILVDKDGRVPGDIKVLLSAILGFVAGFLIVSDYWY